MYLSQIYFVYFFSRYYYLNLCENLKFIKLNFDTPYYTSILIIDPPNLLLNFKNTIFLIYFIQKSYFFNLLWSWYYTIIFCPWKWRNIFYYILFHIKRHEFIIIMIIFFLFIYFSLKLYFWIDLNLKIFVQYSKPSKNQKERQRNESNGTL